MSAIQRFGISQWRRIWLASSSGLASRRTFAVAAPAFNLDEQAITIPALNASFHHRWLRDACQCAACVHPSTRQKLHNVADIPPDTAPRDAGVRLTGEGLEVEWTTGHKSFYPNHFLQTHSSRKALAAFHGDLSPKPWDTHIIFKSPNLFIDYCSLKCQSGLLKAMTQLTQYGLLFVFGVPNTETSDKTCELRKLANHFGEIRETFYGELFDVKNVRNSTNIAYTNLDLDLHMDLLYVLPTTVHASPRYTDTISNQIF
jgi:gamma-butyrobetaine dioxygenase